VLISACSAGREDGPGGDIDREVREALTQRVRSDIADDIGIKIADDRPIRHEFRLRNPTDIPIRLVSAMALKTCCSSIGPIPRMVPARGEVAVPVIWKVGHQSGLTRVQFVVATDRDDCRTIDLSLTANLLPAWEVSPLDDVPGKPSMSATSAQSFQVITRRLGDEGLSPPSEIESAEPFRSRFVGEATQETGSGGVVKASRIVEVELAPNQGVGTYSGELRLKWADGSSKTYPVRREVSPRIRLSPSTLVVNSVDGTRTFQVVVRSDERPFRILDVIGPALVKPIVPRPDPALSHVLNFGLDPSRLDRSGTSEIEIVTDHPAQASSKIKVYLVASEKGVTP
jgi:hypothetical protein